MTKAGTPGTPGTLFYSLILSHSLSLDMLNNPKVTLSLSISLCHSQSHSVTHNLTLSLTLTLSQSSHSLNPHTHSILTLSQSSQSLNLSF